MEMIAVLGHAYAATGQKGSIPSARRLDILKTVLSRRAEGIQLSGWLW